MAKERFGSERLKWSADGFDLLCTDEQWGGFPFRFEFSCTNPVMRADGRGEVDSRNLLVVALAYKPWHIIALIDGPTTVTANGMIEPLHHGRITASIQIQGEDNVTVSVEMPRLSSDRFGSWSQALGHIRSRLGGGYDVAAKIQGAVLKTGRFEVLPIDEASLLGSVDTASRVKVDTISLKHGDVDYWGSGSMELDQEGRPSGTISTETNNLTGLINLVEPHLGLSPQQNSNLELILGMLGKTAKIDVIARNGELYVGPFKIGDLKPLY